MSNLPGIMRRTGRIIFGLMWVPFILIFIGMAGLPQGSHDWLEPPPLARTAILLTGVLGALAAVLPAGASLAGGLRNRALLASGEPAAATILNIKPPGERVNDCSLRMSFTLEVRSLSETFQATPEKYVPMHNLTKYQIGMKVNVKYDPTNKTVAAVDMAPPY